MIIDKRTIDVKKTDAQNNILYLLVAQLASKVTGNDTIEIDSTGTPLIECNTEQRSQVQELYDYHAPIITKVMHDYFAVYVHRHKLYCPAVQLLQRTG